MASLAIVPVGLTKFRDQLIHIPEVTPAYAQEMIRELKPWQARFRKSLGTSFVFASDELFIKAGQPFPPVEFYEEGSPFFEGIYPLV